jgi:hypothetical protein
VYNSHMMMPGGGGGGGGGGGVCIMGRGKKATHGMRVPPDSGGYGGPEAADVGGGCGQRMWAAHVGSACGQRMWASPAWARAAVAAGGRAAAVAAQEPGRRSGRAGGAAEFPTECVNVPGGAELAEAQQLGRHVGDLAVGGKGQGVAGEGSSAATRQARGGRPGPWARPDPGLRQGLPWRRGGGTWGRPGGGAASGGGQCGRPARPKGRRPVPEGPAEPRAPRTVPTVQVERCVWPTLSMRLRPKSATFEGGGDCGEADAHGRGRVRGLGCSRGARWVRARTSDRQRARWLLGSEALPIGRGARRRAGRRA